MKLFKLYLLLFFSFSIKVGLFAQPYFNQRFDFNQMPQSNFSGFCVRNDTVYCLGQVLDSSGYFSLLYSQVSYSGLIDYDTFNLLGSTSGAQTFYTFVSPQFLSNDRLGGFCTISYRIVTALSINIDNDSLSYIPLPSIYGAHQDFAAVTDWSMLSDSGFIVVYNVGSDQLSAFDAGFAVLRLDKFYQVVWHKIFDFPLDEGVSCVTQATDGAFLLGGHLYDYSTPYHSIDQSLILKIDSFGNIVWQFLSPHDDLWSHVNDLVEMPDGTIIGATARGKDVGTNPFISTTLHYPMVFKIDTNQNLVWAKEIGLGSYNYAESQFYALTYDNGGNGIVAAGSAGYSNGPQDTNLSGWIANISSNGDSIWARTITILPDSILFDHHVLLALQTNSSGTGYWLAGYVINSDGNEFPSMRAWLAGVDNVGCVSSNCQLSDAISPLTGEFSEILVYPNPVKDYVIIEVPETFRHKQAVLTISDFSGRILMRKHIDSNTSSIIHLQTDLFKNGLYRITILDHRGNFVDEKHFLKM